MSSDTPSIGCEYWLEDLKAYLDDELPTARRSAIETHLFSCATCSRELSIMQAIQEELRADEEAQAPPLSPALKSRILENIPEPVTASRQAGRGNTWELPQTITPTTGRRSALRWYEYAILASVLLFIGAGTLTLMGGRVKNTFNSAASRIQTTPDFDAAPPAASAPNSSGALALPNGSAWRDRTAASAQGESAPQAENWSGRLQAKASPAANSPNRRIQRRASVSLDVKDIEAASSSVEARVRESGGYIVTNSLTTSEGEEKTANLEVKVPSNRFESVLRQISGLGEVRAKDISGQDVTEQYVSANARRNVLGDELAVRQAQLRELEQRSRNADTDLRWKLRAEVRRLRVQTAEAKAKLDWLRKTTDLSDVSIVLREQKAAPTPAGFMESVGNSGREAWSSFTEAAKIPITVLIWIIAYSPFWVPALILWRRYGTASKRASANQQT